MRKARKPDSKKRDDRVMRIIRKENRGLSVSELREKLIEIKSYRVNKLVNIVKAKQKRKEMDLELKNLESQDLDLVSEYFADHTRIIFDDKKGSVYFE